MPPDAPARDDPRTRLAVVLWVYVAALAAGTLVAVRLDDWHPLGQMLLADLAATAVVFLASFALNNSSLYDPYWSVAPFAIAVWWFADDGGLPARERMVAAVLALWGARLTWNFWRRWPGLAHEDWRYDDMRAYGPLLYWPVSLFGLHLVPTLVVFAALLPVWGISATADPLGPMTWAGLAVCIGAVLLEELADGQLQRFQAGAPPPDAVLDTGVWAWSRNPNYLGEIAFWWGLWVIAFGSSWVNAWTAVGPALVTALFLFVSIPLKEARMEGRGETWARYADRTPRLIPRPYAAAPTERA